MSIVNSTRTVVIAGATGGLGAALAADQARHGANLVLLGRSLEALEDLAASLSVPGERVLTYAVDLLDASAAHAAAAAVVQRFGRADVLLHVVGGWVGGDTLVDTAADDLAFMLNQHVWTSFYAAQAFVPSMLTHGYGRIIMITSPLGMRPSAKSGAYAIGKAGQEALMLTLAQELKGSGVTANVLQARVIDMERKKVHAPSPENSSWTTPEEFAAAVRFLLGKEAAAVNGAKIPMFGSYS